MSGMELNEDVTWEILQRLPAKSLFRFTCVCKSWRSRIRSPDFVEAHHRTQRAIHDHNANAKFLVRRTGLSRTNFFTIMDFGIDKEENVSVKGKENIHFSFYATNAATPVVYGHPFSSVVEVSVFGPCNGIVLLDRYNKPVLWNPATREVKFLPPSKVMPAPPTNSYESSSFVLGFGYDPASNDYKVLRTVFVGYTFDDILSRAVYRIELYSLNKNEWRLLCYGSYCNPPRQTLCMDGVCHIFQHSGVLSFNLVDETFTWTKLPKCMLASEVVLTSMDGYLGIIRYTFGGNFLEIFVLKEIGVNNSWTKQATIGPLAHITGFQGFLKNMILVEIKTAQLVVYNPKNRKRETLQIGSAHQRLGPIHWTKLWHSAMDKREFPRSEKMMFMDYVESLVPLNGRPEQEEGIFRSLF